MAKFIESKFRSVIKTITWRTIAFASSIFIVNFFVMEISQSLKIAIAANISGVILYYIHERVWAHIKLGLEVDDG